MEAAAEVVEVPPGAKEITSFPCQGPITWETQLETATTAARSAIWPQDALNRRRNDVGNVTKLGIYRMNAGPPGEEMPVEVGAGAEEIEAGEDLEEDQRTKFGKWKKYPMIEVLSTRLALLTSNLMNKKTSSART